MALVFVAKDMTVTNPVGLVNVHPLPVLPPGLTRVHLLRRSLQQVQINLVDGTITGLSEVVYGSQGSHEYNDTNVFTDTRGAGWEDQNWVFNFDSSGVTWMSVANEDTAAGDNVAQMMSLDYNEPLSGTAALQFRSGDVRAAMHGGVGHRGVQVSYGSVDKPFMGFSTHHPDGTLEAYVPHNDGFNSAEFTYDTTNNVGVAIGTSSADYDVEHHNRQYLVAEWNRRLSQSEMQAAYQAFKPWLLARGVEIM